jgi:hypothetical protein
VAALGRALERGGPFGGARGCDAMSYAVTICAVTIGARILRQTFEPWQAFRNVIKTAELMTGRPALFQAVVAYSAAMACTGALSSAVRHFAKASPSGSSRAAVRALATASATARAGMASPASAGAMTRAAIRS